MKAIVLCALASFPILAKDCEYGKAFTCAKDEFCINVDKGKMECEKNYTGPLPELEFPFASGVVVTCDQGSLSPPGNSHTWKNTAFALDLQSDRKLSDVPVFAGLAGKVISYEACLTQNDQCGLGFGNSVKILREDGMMLFYAHLKKVEVKTGATVRVGDRIGIEGTTGWTGEGNRHLHVSLHFDWRAQGFDYWKQTGYLPASVPYKLGICEECSANCKKTSVDIRKIDCVRTNKNAKALCSGS